MSAYLGAILGVLAIFATPLTVKSAPDEYKHKIVDLYHRAAANGFGRIALVVRSHTGLAVKSMSYDTEMKMEEMKNDGEEYSYTDPGRMMMTYKGKPMGIVWEDDNIIGGPSVPALGEARKRALRRVSSSENPPVAYPVPEEKRLVDLGMAEYTRAVSGDPQLQGLISDFMEESQRRLTPDTTKGKTIMIILAMAAGAAVPLALYFITGSGGGGGVGVGSAVDSVIGVIIW